MSAAGGGITAGLYGSAGIRTRRGRSTTGGTPIRAEGVRLGRPTEEVYGVRVERAAAEERLRELGVGRWSTWRTGRCRLPWDWHVDQEVYVVEGTVRVVPEGSSRSMTFSKGDIVRYPKWFEADLFFSGPYEERYRFIAYGDD
ncbi:hypothetical protein QJS10_CPA10g01370 [Acorus calamus]|uniref:(S)-ureidoglycine aminohydrolase cupin domain-containing protein n=1 Tax=Acorus calamus TaxID=4465 RepID=A0AAV9E1U7_ACOCL|nr:hypothetical protein QJS10_CPA10g01370 [Acorus calamus]